LKLRPSLIFASEQMKLAVMVRGVKFTEHAVPITVSAFDWGRGAVIM